MNSSKSVASATAYPNYAFPSLNPKFQRNLRNFNSHYGCMKITFKLKMERWAGREAKENFFFVCETEFNFMESRC